MNFNDKKISVFISAGDISGDIHAGSLAKQIKSLPCNTAVFSIGGSELKKVSDVFVEDIVNINAFGFFPLKQVLFLKQLFNRIKLFFEKNKIDKVILVDYYGFNIHLAELAHSMNIPVYYYVSPQIWASRKYRIKKIAKYVKTVFPILPFEKDIYAKEGVNAVFEGNPLIDIVPDAEENKILDGKQIIIGLFAGSRKNTVKRHLPVIIETAKLLKDKINARFILFSADDTKYDLPDFISVAGGTDFEQRKNIDIALCPSGTVSLENALMGIPMVVMYKLAWANYLLARLIVTVKYITLANIMADREIVPEYIQHKATPANISSAIINILNPEIYKEKRCQLLQFRNLLGKKGVAYRVAQQIIGDNNEL